MKRMEHSHSLVVLFLMACISGIVFSGPLTPRMSRVRRQNMKVRINITGDTIVMKFLRTNADTKLEGYILGYGGSMFSRQFIQLPKDGQPYETEFDAEPKYLIAVQPVPTNDVKKQCTGKVELEKPLHLVIGSVTPTSVLLSWGTLLKTPYEGNIMNDCLRDGHYTVRYREKNRKWNYQKCTTSDTVIDKLQPNTLYEFGVQPSSKDGTGVWSKPVIHNMSAPNIHGTPNKKIFPLHSGKHTPAVQGPNSSAFTHPHVHRNRTKNILPLPPNISPKTTLAPPITAKQESLSTPGPPPPVVTEKPIGGGHLSRSVLPPLLEVQLTPKLDPPLHSTTTMVSPPISQTHLDKYGEHPLTQPHQNAHSQPHVRPEQNPQIQPQFLPQPKPQTPKPQIKLTLMSQPPSQPQTEPLFQSQQPPTTPQPKRQNQLLPKPQKTPHTCHQETFHPIHQTQRQPWPGPQPKPQNEAQPKPTFLTQPQTVKQYQHPPTSKPILQTKSQPPPTFQTKPKNEPQITFHPQSEDEEQSQTQLKSQPNSHNRLQPGLHPTSNLILQMESQPQPTYKPIPKNEPQPKSQTTFRPPSDSKELQHWQKSQDKPQNQHQPHQLTPQPIPQYEPYPQHHPTFQPQFENQQPQPTSKAILQNKLKSHSKPVFKTQTQSPPKPLSTPKPILQAQPQTLKPQNEPHPQLQTTFQPQSENHQQQQTKPTSPPVFHTKTHLQSISQPKPQKEPQPHIHPTIEPQCEHHQHPHVQPPPVLQTQTQSHSKSQSTSQYEPNPQHHLTFQPQSENQQQTQTPPTFQPPPKSPQQPQSTSKPKLQAQSQPLPSQTKPQNEPQLTYHPQSEDKQSQPKQKSQPIPQHEPQPQHHPTSQPQSENQQQPQHHPTSETFPQSKLKSQQSAFQPKPKSPPKPLSTSKPILQAQPKTPKPKNKTHSQLQTAFQPQSETQHQSQSQPTSQSTVQKTFQSILPTQLQPSFQPHTQTKQEPQPQPISKPILQNQEQSTLQPILLTEQKSTSHPMLQTQRQPQPTFQPTFKTKPTPQKQAHLKSQPIPQNQPHPQAERTPQSTSQSQLYLHPYPQPTTGSILMTQPTLKTERHFPQPKSKIESQANDKHKSKTQSQPKSKLSPKNKAKSKFNKFQMPKTKKLPKPYTNKQQEPQLKIQPWPKSNPQIKTHTQPVTQSQPIPQPQPSSKSQLEPLSKPTSRPQAQPQTEPQILSQNRTYSDPTRVTPRQAVTTAPSPPEGGNPLPRPELATENPGSYNQGTDVLRPSIAEVPNSPISSSAPPTGRNMTLSPRVPPHTSTNVRLFPPSKTFTTSLISSTPRADGVHHSDNALPKPVRSKEKPVLPPAIPINLVKKPGAQEKAMDLKQGDQESILKSLALVTAKPKQERRPEMTTSAPVSNTTRFDINENSTIFRPLPTSDVDIMGKKRYVAPHVIYKTDKKPDEPCSITSALAYFPDEEGSDLNVTGPPRIPPSNLTVVTVEGCPSFVILDWQKSDNDTREYQVVSTTKGPHGRETSVLTTNQTHTAVENLKPESSYEFTVIPKNELGTGPSSDPVSFSTESADPRVSEYVSGKDAIWTQFPFKSDAYSECNGKMFVKRTWYRKFVGIQLCNSLRYQIYLSDSLTGKFYNIGDQTGYGEDHCQFVDSFLDGRTGNQMSADQLPNRLGFYRAMRQEPVSFGQIGGKSHSTYVGWYECGTPIPGKW